MQAEPDLLVNPRYRELLEQCGLRTMADFQALPSLIISGHPDRNVARVNVGSAGSTFAAFLKREHRVPWRDRLTNALAGFGFVSKSCREALLLQALAEAQIGCPEWLAAGEDSQGRAFLLLRELPDSVELRVFLQNSLSASQRRLFARRLGEALARLHAAGFDHPDLYAKHVLVNPANQAIHFLDWQRSRRRRYLGGRRCGHDLAALQATLADHLANDRERLICLRAYLKHYHQSPVAQERSWASGGVHPRRAGAERPFHRDKPGGSPEASLVQVILRHARRYLRRRHVREQRQPPLVTGRQNLIWLDGEGLCVTRELRRALPGPVAPWLLAASQPARTDSTSGTLIERTRVTLPGGNRACLVRRWELGLTTWLVSLVRRRPLSEFQHAAILFRLERYGISTPRLLAVGQRRLGLASTYSFLLTEPLAGTVNLATWLARDSRRNDRKERWQILRAAGTLLNRVHEAGCCFAGRLPEGSASSWLVQVSPGSKPALVLGSVEGLRVRRRLSQARKVRDLATLVNVVAAGACNRADRLRVLLGYLGVQHLTPVTRRDPRKLSGTARRALLFQYC